MPIPDLSTSDVPKWTQSKDNKFTVKGAYEFMRHNRSNQAQHISSNIQNTSFYKNLWQLKIPPKIRHFLHGAIRDKLPTTTNLVKRKIQISEMCCFCDSQNGDILHVLNNCIFTKEVCFHLSISRDTTNYTNFQDLFERYRKKLPPDLFKRWIICLWDTWHQRNRKIQGENIRTPKEIVCFGTFYLETFDSAPNLLKSIQPPRI